MSWSRAFESPVPTAGKPLVTLRDAAKYIECLPKAEHETPHWQTATEVLIMAAEGRGPLLHARVGMLQAMQRGKPKPAMEPRRKRAKAYRIVK